MSTPSHTHENSGDGGLPSSARMASLVEYIAVWKNKLAEGRALSPPHHTFKPRWDLHDSRLDEIERLSRTEPQPDWERIEALDSDFLLDFQADMAASMAEASEGFVRITDLMAQRLEEKKFELPPETRDSLEEMLLPYQDGIRDKMLDALPIETRRKLEEEKRRLAEE